VRVVSSGSSVTRRSSTGAFDSSKALRAIGMARAAVYQCISELGGELGLGSVFIKNKDHRASFYRGFVPGHSRR
jgi:hypothetical protein